MTRCWARCCRRCCRAPGNASGQRWHCSLAALALLIARFGEATALVAVNHMAVGVELLPTASLVHDDIVDASDTRRGAATLYSRVGNALAVLVGDYLFSQAAQECVATGHLGV